MDGRYWPYPPRASPPTVPPSRISTRGRDRPGDRTLPGLQRIGEAVIIDREGDRAMWCAKRTWAHRSNRTLSPDIRSMPSSPDGAGGVVTKGALKRHGRGRLRPPPRGPGRWQRKPTSAPSLSAALPRAEGSPGE